MRRFGLIGFPLSHSFSKRFFEKKFLDEGLFHCVYENYAIPSIAQFEELVTINSLAGLNVTIPYKQQVIPYLNIVDEVVAATGACNCIKFKHGQLHGYNTDTIGFEQSLQKYLLPTHNKAIILGTGGAAKAIRYVLEKLEIAHISVSSSKAEIEKQLYHYTSLTDDLISTSTLIINTTPLGMYPDINAAPPINYDLITPSHYLFDVVYNPEITLFLKKGSEKGATIQNGLNMLIIQAEESWKIWNHDHL